MRKFFYKASILLWTLQGFMLGFASEDGSGQVTEVKSFKGIQWLYAFFTWLLIGVAAYIFG